MVRAMATGATRAIWLKWGLWPAMIVALAPIAIALLHLLPAATAAEQPIAVQRPVLEQRSAHHGEPRTITVAEFDALIAADAEHCSPQPGAPAHQTQPSCPLCYWLQGFHVLPSPDGPLLALPRRHVLTFITRDLALSITTFRLAAQPRAPPDSLQT